MVSVKVFKMWILAQAFLLIFLVQNVTPKIIRKTKYGLVRGERATSLSDPHTEYYSFRGIPYATPPVGKLRFKEPIPPKPWKGIKTTIEPFLDCPQIANNFWGKSVVGSEDCLKLDVFEPITARENGELLPVIVWIHGGAFIYGSVNLSGPDYFMEKPIVVVEIAYRVNVLGFLTTMDKEAPGNLGLKDQRLGLRWIHENIANFGGDPNKVTIAGESAGGASVLCHMLDKQSQEYFRHAISQSGVTINRWALLRNPREMTIKLARALGVTSNNSKTIIEEFQKIHYDTLIETGFNKSVIGYYTSYYAYPFDAIIEVDSETAIMSESTLKMLKEGNHAKKPYLIGFNTEEGSYAYDYIHRSKTDINIYKEDPGWFVPISMNILRDSPSFNQSLEEILKFYFKSGDVTNKVDWTNYMSQELFVRGIVKTMELMYKQLPLYFYRFSFTGSKQLSYNGGVGHYEEVQYLFFSRMLNNTTESVEDNLTRRRMVTMWYNFANTGNPIPEPDELLENQKWPLMDDNKWYMDIGKNLSLHQYPNKEDSDFWEDLFEKYGIPPYDIY